MNTFNMDLLFEYFKTEISNKIQYLNGEIIVLLADGKKAKVRLFDLE